MEEIKTIAIDDQLSEIISVETEKAKNNENASRLSEANDFYNQLVKDGTIKKRGYTLAGIDTAVRYNVNFNRR